MKNTEDSVVLAPGDGFWRTALGKGSYRLSVLEKNDGKGTPPFADDCQRIQNGFQTTNNSRAAAQMAPLVTGRGELATQPSAAPAQPQGLQIDIAAMGCIDQFKLGYFNFIRRIRDRRFRCG